MAFAAADVGGPFPDEASQPQPSRRGWSVTLAPTTAKDGRPCKQGLHLIRPDCPPAYLSVTSSMRNVVGSEVSLVVWKNTLTDWPL